MVMNFEREIIVYLDSQGNVIPNGDLFYVGQITQWIRSDGTALPDGILPEGIKNSDQVHATIA